MIFRDFLNITVMRFLSNTYDPTLPNARMHQTLSYQSFLDPKLADHEWEMYLKWINSNIKGRPRATKEYTTEQLEGMGMIGVYADDEPKNLGKNESK